MNQSAPFATFAPPIRPATATRRAITAAYRRPEAECMAPILVAAELPAGQKDAIARTARNLVERLRDDPERSGIAALVQEFGLSNQEGVALMCLAEALLRIPDTRTRDALIRDKIAPGDWKAHLGLDRSLFLNAATWGLIVTGRLTSRVSSTGLSSALTRLIARAGEPVIRKATVLAMRLLGEQFVTGRTIDEALARSREMEARGFTYSFDMLGEAAMTERDAQLYYDSYGDAIHAIGRAAAGRGVIDGPGISVKLSALHPRYERGHAERVMAELLPRAAMLARLAKSYDIGFNIDAEEADRLELSLDLLESLCLDPELTGWNGLGFVVQAYGKRCPFVIDHIVDLARRSQRRIMVRLVKGAYWDSEIKRAQAAGLADFPVYTRKEHTDIAYIACARKLLAAKSHVFPQFATHNAQTVATIYHLAGADFRHGDYEFQCLHGMGEALYGHVVGRGNLGRPCRIYAPVGEHETLLAYLVRRLLENGANSSFVNRISDPAVPVETLIVDPVDVALAHLAPGSPHPLILLPPNLYPDRANSRGIDLSDESALADLCGQLRESAPVEWRAKGIARTSSARPVRNPADNGDVVGHVVEATEEEVEAAVRRACASGWSSTEPAERAALLERAADLLEDRMPRLMGLAIREAGKSAANAIGEVREAVDFLRYYANEGRSRLGPDHVPLGPIAAISPWNFPLAIFTGQVGAALMAGNPVLAKPAEETPLIAAEAVRILHEAGIPEEALQLVPGDGRVGAALVAAPEICGVVFTGSTEVARLIQAQLATRLSTSGRPVPLIAETGGQNAMIVDSSALTEQVVAQVVSSAFDSAGQRCSALRVLCLQEEVADKTLAMLRGAMAELSVGPTERLANDIGPVISEAAKRNIEAYIRRARDRGAAVTRLDAGPETAKGAFVAPTIIEISSLADLEGEIFGPVLHVLRYDQRELDPLIEAINSLGYGLTFGVASRLDEMVGHCARRVDVGNIYVNRNMIGAVVGSQPFGGRGLSGTGPKAGGPLYLGRFTEGPGFTLSGGAAPSALEEFAAWLDLRGHGDCARSARSYGDDAFTGANLLLPGPVGEENRYTVEPRGVVALYPRTRFGLFDQIAATFAAGNAVVIERPGLADALVDLPEAVAKLILPAQHRPVDAALIEGEGVEICSILGELAARPGPLIPVQAASGDACRSGGAYRLDLLVHERSISTDTTASGGNAALLALV